MEEIKKCHFCGSKPEITKAMVNDGEYFIECSNDDCPSYVVGTKAEAITAWNTRVSPWVAVGDVDTKPKEKTWIVIRMAILGGHPQTAFFDGRFYIFTSSDHRESLLNNYNGEPYKTWESGRFTHWMPIPPLPSQEETP